MLSPVLQATLQRAVAERRNGPNGQRRAGSARLIGLSMRTGPSSTLTVSRTFDGALKLRELEERVTDETKVYINPTGAFEIGGHAVFLRWLELGVLGIAAVILALPFDHVGVFRRLAVDRP